jgi:hypothetical protein
LLAGLAGDIWLVVFEVHVPDPAGKFMNALHWISSRKCPMARVETQT